MPARKSLRPYLNQIRAWTRQGRTDAWVAHQLEVSVHDVREFKRQNELLGGDESGPPTGASEEEIDLRAADEALIAAELEAAETEAGEPASAETLERGGEGNGSAPVDTEQQLRPRRRGRRGGAGRRPAARRSEPMEGTFDHGEEGYGLWLDPAVRDNPVYAEHWAGHRPVEVRVEEDQIVISRLDGSSQDRAAEEPPGDSPPGDSSPDDY